MSDGRQNGKRTYLDISLLLYSTIVSTTLVFTVHLAIDALGLHQ